MRADKKISWGMTLLTAMMLQACGGGGGGSTVATPPPVVQGAVQVAPNAAAITLADQQQIQSVEEAPIDPLADDGSRVKMTFAHPSAALAAVPVGQVLVFDQDTHFPEGYAGKVTSRTVNPDGSVTVSFKDAQLTEVFKNLKIEATPENSALKNPRVYPADGMAQFLAPPEGVVARQAGLLEENTTSLEPVAVAAGQYSMKPKFVFPIVIMDEKDGKGGIDAFLNKSCDDLKDKWGKGKAFRSCVALTLTATVNIDKFQTKKIIIGIKDGNLEEYTSQTSAEVNGELKFEAKVEALHGHSFEFSFLDALRKGLAKINIKSTIPKDADEGTYKAGPLRFKGVPYEEDKLVLATVVYDLAKFSTGLGAFGVQKGERVIGFSPKIYLTPFMKGSLEFKGKASLTYTSPRYRVLQVARFQEELRGGEKVLVHKEDLTPSERFTKIAEDSIALGMEGEAAAGISVGVDASVGMLNIVPLNITLFEAGVNASISGKYDVEVGKPGTWCHSDGAITAGIRSFVDVAMDLSIAKPGDDWHVVGYAYHLPIFPRSNPENWDSQFAPEWLSLGTDTCHQPKITRVDWLGGDFINNHYPFQFDASETGYKPLIDYLEWDFGDGVKLACLGSELDSKPDCLRPEHVYNQMGEYSAKLAVYYRDENDRKALTIGVGGVVDFDLPDPNLYGDSGEFPHKVTAAIKIEKPYVSLMLKQGSGMTANVNLIGLNHKALSYVVDWGDGQTSAGQWQDDMDARLMHTYDIAHAGNNVVKLTVKDRFGSTYSWEEGVTVLNQQGIATTSPGKTVQAGVETGFTLTGLMDDVKTVFWDFGDAVAGLYHDVLDAISHTFSAVGDYLVKATLFNDRNQELGVVEQNVTVETFSFDRLSVSTAAVNKPVTLTVFGKFIPADAVLVFQDAVCDPPATHDANSFTQTCTPKSVGAKTITVKPKAGVDAGSRTFSIKVVADSVYDGAFTVYAASANGSYFVSPSSTQALQCRFTATGKTRTNPAFPESNANGLLKGTAGLPDNYDYLNGLPGMALVTGQVAGIQLVGTDKVLSIPANNALWFRVNDDNTADNSGQYEVAYHCAGQIAEATPGPLNDTGITACWDNASMIGDCATASLGLWFDLNQDGQSGRDALAAKGKLTKVGAGSAGFDFTKIDANGNPLPPSAASWSCVRDNHTGLMWEVKNPGNMGTTYQWYNPDAATNGGFAGYENGGNNTHAFVNEVNRQGLCGHNDWRLPDRMELAGLVDLSKPYPGPTIDTAYFPNTAQSWYWTSSSLAADDDGAWLVGFQYGDTTYYAKYAPYYVRVVRTGQ